MSTTNENNLVAYDFAAWRATLGWTKTEAANALGVSQATYWRLEKSGLGSKVYAWACYGINKRMEEQKNDSPEG